MYRVTVSRKPPDCYHKRRSNALLYPRGPLSDGCLKHRVSHTQGHRSTSHLSMYRVTVSRKPPDCFAKRRSNALLYPRGPLSGGCLKHRVSHTQGHRSTSHLSIYRVAVSRKPPDCFAGSLKRRTCAPLYPRHVT